jgi:hypothetical protein
MDENVVKRYQLAQEPPTAALAAVERDAQCMHADEHGSKIPEIKNICRTSMIYSF